MIFLTAQPDRVKFLWQLKVQLYNFIKMGIDPSNVHYLIGLDHGIGPTEAAMKFKNEAPCHVFFYYNEARKDSGYIPLVRPNIIKQHFLQFPQLTDEQVFYMDSDVLFSRPMDFSVFPANGDWYVSDTRNYIWSKYIVGCAGIKVFQDMCRIVGIDPFLVQANDNMAGGAQYITIGTDFNYWNKVERDSELLYKWVASNTPIFEAIWQCEQDARIIRALKSNAKQEQLNALLAQKQSYQKLQIWCADMWAVLWNAWLRGFKTIIKPELSFSWAVSAVKDFEERPLFHYAGVDGHSNQEYINGQHNKLYPHFDKFVYDSVEPFGKDHSHINPQSATIKLVEIINAITREKWLWDGE